MTLTERLLDAQARAAQLYLRRQELEGQSQIVAQQTRACDFALMKVGGEIETIQSLLAAEQGVTHGN